MKQYERGVHRIYDTPAGKHILDICRSQHTRASNTALTPLPPACTACGERGGITKAATPCTCDGAINNRHTAHTCSHCGTTRYTSRCTTPKEDDTP